MWHLVLDSLATGNILYNLRGFYKIPFHFTTFQLIWASSTQSLFTYQSCHPRIWSCHLCFHRLWQEHSFLDEETKTAHTTADVVSMPCGVEARHSCSCTQIQLQWTSKYHLYLLCFLHLNTCISGTGSHCTYSFSNLSPCRLQHIFLFLETKGGPHICPSYTAPALMFNLSKSHWSSLHSSQSLYFLNFVSPQTLKCSI